LPSFGTAVRERERDGDRERGGERERDGDRERGMGRERGGQCIVTVGRVNCLLGLQQKPIHTLKVKDKRERCNV